MLGEQRARGLIDILVRHPSAPVRVGDQPDAKSFERRRQTGDRQCRPRQADFVPLIEVPVSGGTADETETAGRKRLEEGAAGHQHRSI